jgi:hypothetical protein
LAGPGLYPAYTRRLLQSLLALFLWVGVRSGYVGSNSPVLLQCSHQALRHGWHSVSRYGAFSHVRQVAGRSLFLPFLSRRNLHSSLMSRNVAMLRRSGTSCKSKRGESRAAGVVHRRERGKGACKDSDLCKCGRLGRTGSRRTRDYSVSSGLQSFVSVTKGLSRNVVLLWAVTTGQGRRTRAGDSDSSRKDHGESIVRSLSSAVYLELRVTARLKRKMPQLARPCGRGKGGGGAKALDVVRCD